jgi:hypothetical protein
MPHPAPRILRAADRRATPWKNGLGVTREIAVHPPGAGLDDFDWRISMASVDAGGPFSIFLGTDRLLAVLEGRLALSIDGGAPVELDPRSPPLAFPGDVPAHAELPTGPVTDLNLMTRRGRVRGAMERLEIDQSTTVALSNPTIILVRTNSVCLACGTDQWSLEVDDAVLLDPASSRTVRLEPAGPSMLFAIRLEKA